MPESKTIDDLKTYYPHRYENQLVDTAILHTESDDHYAESTTLITQNDSLGRDLFYKSDGTLIGSVYAEILALISIAATGQIPDHITAVFAGISQFKKTGDSQLGHPITTKVRQLSSKASFLKYGGQVFNEAGDEIVSSHISAFYAENTSFGSGEGKKKGEIPAHPPLSPVSPNLFNKQPSMICVNSLAILPDNGIVTGYTYPTDHPFVKGHFPSSPIMMGVMQIMAIEDSVLAWANETNTNANQVTVSGSLYKTDGTVVAEFKGIKVGLRHKAAQCQSDLLEINRITFRDVVTPGTELRTVISHLQIDE